MNQQVRFCVMVKNNLALKLTNKLMLFKRRSLWVTFGRMNFSPKCIKPIAQLTIDNLFDREMVSEIHLTDQKFWTFFLI